MFEKITQWWTSSHTPSSDKYDPTDPKVNPLNPKGLKPCCACPETKSARDECFLRWGPDADQTCKEAVQKHIACMKGLGFKI